MSDLFVVPSEIRRYSDETQTLFHFSQRIDHIMLPFSLTPHGPSRHSHNALRPNKASHSVRARETGEFVSIVDSTVPSTVQGHLKTNRTLFFFLQYHFQTLVTKYKYKSGSQFWTRRSEERKKKRNKREREKPRRAVLDWLTKSGQRKRPLAPCNQTQLGRSSQKCIF